MRDINRACTNRVIQLGRVAQLCAAGKDFHFDRAVGARFKIARPGLHEIGVHPVRRGQEMRKLQLNGLGAGRRARHGQNGRHKCR